MNDPDDGPVDHGGQDAERHGLLLDHQCVKKRKSSVGHGDGGADVDGCGEEEEVWTNRRYRIEKVMLNAIFSMQF